MWSKLNSDCWGERDIFYDVGTPEEIQLVIWRNKYAHQLKDDLRANFHCLYTIFVKLSTYTEAQEISFEVHKVRVWKKFQNWVIYWFR